MGLQKKRWLQKECSRKRWQKELASTEIVGKANLGYRRREKKEKGIRKKDTVEREQGEEFFKEFFGEFFLGA